ncbi:MAG: hypothetical protein ACRDLN_15300 [Solirubrobacteraceae bacterium]
MEEHEQYLDMTGADDAATFEDPASAVYVPAAEAGSPPVAAGPDATAAAAELDDEPLYDAADPKFGSAGYRYDIDDAVSDKGNPVSGTPPGACTTG